MRFEIGRSFKRSREPQAVDTRPLKKCSPTPSEYHPDEDFRQMGLQEPLTPTVSPSKVDFESADKLSIPSPLSRDFAHLSLLRQASPTPWRRDRRRAHQIFEIPEILEKILRHVAMAEEAPAENTCARRRPLSYRHAALIYGDEKRAAEVWKQSLREAAGRGTRESRVPGPLFSCLLVNKLWHSIALPCLLERVHFRDSDRFSAFMVNRERMLATDGEMARPCVFTLEKLHRLSQSEFDRLSALVAVDRLKWLELYICPKVLPPLSWIPNFKRLEKLILPGNKVINDKFLFELSHYVPDLKKLDLRACDNVTDSGIVAIALRCTKLELCNLGRHRNGGRITSISVVALAKHTQIETLGIAGCNVTDAGIWELAQLRGPHMTRLSLNNCSLLSNHSIPLLLAFNHFPNLAVLEVRNIDGITDVRNLVHFKLWKKSQRIPILIEGCERITKLMLDEEARLRRANSQVALKDMTYWVNS
ncbi:hypothetical protein HG536_0H01310 [Torulaspora globosa]|uniref:F-box/LRR-repeat protein 15-like leucin rich repeat domain-containing protein n=1 Tax=Torulaspora globosa TaxID=48254 RepID=A0A7G3ZMM0_9SACH|nr:uncharacterized protein HG536_0H01310 [Torulaspora globosa]QLL34756.1 hypothetical protein HG536_0H01310 [Torulaspora globosa]